MSSLTHLLTQLLQNLLFFTLKQKRYIRHVCTASPPVPRQSMSSLAPYHKINGLLNEVNTLFNEA